MIDAILTNTMLPDISREFLGRMMGGVGGRLGVGLRMGSLSISLSRVGIVD